MPVMADKKYLKRLSDYGAIPATDYLIEPHVPLGALIFVAGLPKTFKTFLSGIDWGYSVATGCQWLGRSTRKGRVLYFALESYHGVLRRAEAWRLFHKKSKADGDDLVYVTDRISFAEKTCSADQHFTTLYNAGYRPDLVIIDTWFKATAGAEVGGQVDLGIRLDHDLIQPVGEALSHPTRLDQTLHGVVEGVIAKPLLASPHLGDLEPLGIARPALRAAVEREQGVECQVVEGVLFGSFLGVLFGLLGFSQWLIKDRHFLADDEVLFLAFGSDDRNLFHLECDRGRVLNVSRAYMSVALKNLRSFQDRLTEWKVEDGLPAVTFVVIAHN